MTHKQILYDSMAREKILCGATQLANAVRVTLGPKSKSVLIEKKWGVPIVCNDGVTIAKEVDLEDPAENLGARMLREAAEKTGDAVGDGTTTATILAHSIFTEGIRNVVAGASGIDIKRGLDRGLAVGGGIPGASFQTGQDPAKRRRRSQPFPRITIRLSANSSRTHWRKSATKG